MCQSQAKGGKRCAPHARQAFLRSYRTLEVETIAGHPMERHRTDLKTDTISYARTPEGRMELMRFLHAIEGNVAPGLIQLIRESTIEGERQAQIEEDVKVLVKSQQSAHDIALESATAQSVLKSALSGMNLQRDSYLFARDIEYGLRSKNLTPWEIYKATMIAAKKVFDEVVDSEEKARIEEYKNKNLALDGLDQYEIDDAIHHAREMVLDENTCYQAQLFYEAIHTVAGEIYSASATQEEIAKADPDEQLPYRLVINQIVSKAWNQANNEDAFKVNYALGYDETYIALLEEINILAKKINAAWEPEYPKLFRLPEIQKAIARAKAETNFPAQYAQGVETAYAGLIARTNTLVQELNEVWVLHTMKSSSKRRIILLPRTHEELKDLLDKAVDSATEGMVDDPWF